MKFFFQRVTKSKTVSKTEYKEPPMLKKGKMTNVQVKKKKTVIKTISPEVQELGECSSHFRVVVLKEEIELSFPSDR